MKSYAILGMATAITLACASAVAYAAAERDHKPDLHGMWFQKDTPLVPVQKTLESLHGELDSVTAMLKDNALKMEKQYTDLNNHFGGLKGDNEQLKADVKKHADDYAELVTKHQTLLQAVDQIKKELNTPLMNGGKDLAESDRKAAVELQRRAFLFKGGNEFEFRPDMDNLVNLADYRTAAMKMMRVGIDDKQTIMKSFSQAERKAFDGASMDIAFFNPQMLGIKLDCEIECAELLDLYMDITVSRSTYMYPQVTSYGDIGSYQCPAKCDAELGPEGNIEWKNGRTYDFRGVFCFQREVLQEANYDLLGFMMRAANRSHRINRNRALITGDGVNEPRGWLKQDCFTKLKTGAASFNHQDFRRFIASAPVEYGPVVATMHQNVFAYLAAHVDNNGRFIFGDGLMTYSPDNVRERIRISNCLPDPTDGGTKGSATAPFDANDFIAAAGNWKMAYGVVSRQPMVMEQFIGGSSRWCVQYQFDAKDGGQMLCCAAARTLYTGP